MASYEKRLEFVDQNSGLYAVTVIHSTLRGPAFGGIRLYPYSSESELNEDVERLASAMTLKCAAANLPAGGAKTVVWDREQFRREAGYSALGQMLSKLNGEYVCGPDIGTDENLLQLIRNQTPFVNPKGNNPGQSTARGVLAGISGLLRVLDGTDSLAGKRYAIEGLGSVGLQIADELVKQGAEVIGWDIDSNARQKAKERGVRLLSMDPNKGCVECDVFIPCALGKRIRLDNLANLKCRAICGAANNQLESAPIAEALRLRNIVYVPDFLVNVGAVIEGVWTIQKGEGTNTRSRIDASISDIANTCEGVLRRSKEKYISTLEAALELAKSRLPLNRSSNTQNAK